MADISYSFPWTVTIGVFLKDVVNKDPDKVYLYYKDNRITYKEFYQNSRKAAHMYWNLGVRHGDRVSMFMPNGLEILYSWMGLSMLGAIMVPINTAYRQSEMAYIVQNAEAKVVVTHHSLMEVAVDAVARCTSVEVKMVVSDGGQSFDGWYDFREAIESVENDGGWDDSAVSPGDVSVLVYTSGTTGNPKGVMITHQMFVAAGQGFASWTGGTKDDRYFTCLPYFHANPQYYSTMGSLAAGASLILEDRFSASRFLSQVRESKATVVNFIGMMLPVIMKQPISPEDKENSVRIFYGSPAQPPDVLAEFEERFGVRILIGFALTECCYGTIERIGEPHRYLTAGKARWHPDSSFKNEIVIIDDEGNVLPPNLEGEIVLRNPCVMPGYWKDPEKTMQALKDGWLYTGDMGKMDEDGYLYFVDRIKNVIRRRGENISSQEVEDVIKRHPGVLDCAVIPVPSELGEDEVKVYVVRREWIRDRMENVSSGKKGNITPTDDVSPEEIVYWCAERLAYFKVPRYVEFREDLPRTPSMRVRKEMIRGEQVDLTANCFDREKAGIKIR